MIPIYIIKMITGCRVENGLETVGENIEKVTVTVFKQRMQGTGIRMVAVEKGKSCCRELQLNGRCSTVGPY